MKFTKINQIESKICLKQLTLNVFFVQHENLSKLALFLGGAPTSIGHFFRPSVRSSVRVLPVLLPVFVISFSQLIWVRSLPNFIVKLIGTYLTSLAGS